MAIANQCAQPEPTCNSPISDTELWQCARQEQQQHDTGTITAAARRMAELEEEGDRAGYAT